MDLELHRRSDGRFGERKSTEPEIVLDSEAWLPSELPERLRPVAFAADLIRRLCDEALPNSGQGACLAVSAVIGYYCRQRGIDARLARGTYDGDAHWWVESGGYVFDASAGQFGDELPSISERGAHPYTVQELFPCGHGNELMLYAEARRAFGDPAQADAFMDLALHEMDTAEHLAHR